METSGKRTELLNKQRWVVKIGSSLLTNNGRGLDKPAIAGWVEQMARLRQQGIELVLVSSGAVAAGMRRLGWATRPHAMHELQAAAAVGQMALVHNYEKEFLKYDLQTAQILLVHDDLASRERYLNARSTIKTLIELGVVPIVNENDTVVTDEIRFGDNDTLGALVANIVEADVLILLTDQDGMYTDDPRSNPDAKLLDRVPASDERLDEMAGDGGALGRGGMVTKVRAARLAALSGTHTVIVGGRIPDVIDRLSQGEALGTLLLSDEEPQTARKNWLAGHLQTCGELILDDGAVESLREHGSSLLSVGVTDVFGSFNRGDMVLCLDREGNEVARGLANYCALDARRIAGQSSESIEEILGYMDEVELIHRDNLVLSLMPTTVVEMEL
ncbi:glutamate 5-kinase [Simiduia sp. 21SJ11W-1]|uniref:glutamate 5-kinase n=1 Tax=Simiduia sp. 21SJ11W-1 TaxID=2909669 RepID=UPI00209D7356|nr:glutamate 5-kinase [Simiduia sp. 21SJ11W-1]UTA47347.1 glutamate 5-kinase [Simiduia sp. 21SJ11W-1]